MGRPMKEADNVQKSLTEDLNPFRMAAQQFEQALPYLPGLKKGPD